MSKAFEWLMTYKLVVILGIVLAAERAWLSLLIAPFVVLDYAANKHRKQMNEMRESVARLAASSRKSEQSFNQYKADFNTKLDSLIKRLKSVKRTTQIQYVTKPGIERRKFQLREIQEVSKN